MEEKKAKLINNNKEKNSELYKKENLPIITQNLIKIKSPKNCKIKLDLKIDQNKSIIRDLFIKNFGPHFFKKNSFIDELKYIFGENLLDISEITTDTQEEENTKKKIIKPKKKKLKYDEKTLSTRINMGSMTYLNLMENTVTNKSLFNDKIFYLSKNFLISKKNKKDIADIQSLNKENSKNNFNNKNNNLKRIKIKSILNNKNKSNNINEIEKTQKIKLFRSSMSQQNINTNKITNVLNLKKHLIYNKKEKDFETISPNNQQYFDTEEKNNYININKITQENKYSNVNTNFSNSQNDFFNSEISNYINPKEDKMSLDINRKIIKPIYIYNNMSEANITNNIINNNYKSLSTYETNKDAQSPKKIFKKYNSLINLNTFYNKKKFKEDFNKNANLLNNFINKSNKRLVKLIDHNFTKNKERNVLKQVQRKENFNLIKIIMDKKITKKIIRNFNKPNKIAKSVLSMSQKDENKLKNNKKSEEKYFIENVKNMDDDVALFYIGKLFDTKYIKFPLKEYKKKRIEIKKKKDNDKFLEIKHRLDSNNELINKYKYKLIQDYKQIQNKEN